MEEEELKERIEWLEEREKIFHSTYLDIKKIVWAFTEAVEDFVDEKTLKKITSRYNDLTNGKIIE